VKRRSMVKCLVTTMQNTREVTKSALAALYAAAGTLACPEKDTSQVGESPTEVKRLRPRSLGGTVEGNQDGGALRQHALKRGCAKHPVAT